MLGEHSRWSGYLQSLPRSTVGIALLWGTDQRPFNLDSEDDEDRHEDFRDAATIAVGTEIRKELGGEEGGHFMVCARLRLCREHVWRCWSRRSRMSRLRSAALVKCPRPWAAVLCVSDFAATSLPCCLWRPQHFNKHRNLILSLPVWR